jgi:UDP-hydrolysing UDP-N-acetyl-D-glucosamine 2-epimerase
VTKLSNLHLVSTERAAERVRRMGEDPSCVFVTGCPSIDLAADILASPALDFDVYGRYGGVGPTPDLSDGYLVVLQHPVTTEHDKARRHVNETLEAIDSVGRPTLWFWPNPDAGSDGTSRGIRSFREFHHDAPIHFFRNMAPLDFLRLIYNSQCLVGNSSVGIREASFLGVPVVNAGSRQAGRDRGRNVVDVPYEAGEIKAAIEMQLARPRPAGETIYGNGKAGQQIADVLARAPLRTEKRLTY